MSIFRREQERVRNAGQKAIDFIFRPKPATNFESSVLGRKREFHSMRTALESATKN